MEHFQDVDNRRDENIDAIIEKSVNVRTFKRKNRMVPTDSVGVNFLGIEN